MADGIEECCPDDWSVWLRFETWVWAVLLLIQLSMVAFLMAHGRKDKTFRQAFYVFFVAVTMVDCALALLRTSQEYWGATIFGTAYDDPMTVKEDSWTHEMLSYPTLRGTLNKIVVHVVVPVLRHAQPLFLTAIAANRFTAFAFPLKHASMWRKRTVVVVTASLAATSIILGVACPFVSAIREAVKCSRVTGKERIELYCGMDDWAFQMLFIRRALIILISAICCVASFVLNVGSVATLIVLRTTGKLQRKGPELQLFAHSLWMFLLQLFLTFQDIVAVADYPEIMSYELGLGWAWPWADFRHSSEWLAGVKATRKWVNGELQFTPGCTYHGYWGVSGTVPLCGVWYRLLTGELLLREDPEFTVHTLELCLFALSGSVFLLVISGSVRNAYFSFYFKRLGMKEKQAQHSSVTPFVAWAPTTSTPRRPRVTCAHSLWMLLLQASLTFQDIVAVADYPEIFSYELGLELTWANWAHSSEWLAGMRGTRKWVKCQLQLTPGCTTDGHWNHEAAPTCSMWYSLLVGELRLREDPEFTVRRLELCLFALSGSVFLLVISGSVRNAYFSFYFKRQCFKKNGGHHSSVTSFMTATPIMPTSPRP